MKPRADLHVAVCLIALLQVGCDRTSTTDNRPVLEAIRSPDPFSDRIERIAKSGLFSSADREFVMSNIRSGDATRDRRAANVLSAGVRVQPQLQAWGLDLLRQRIEASTGTQLYIWLFHYARVANLTGAIWLSGELRDLMARSEQEISEVTRQYGDAIEETGVVSEEARSFVNSLWKDPCFRSRLLAAEIFYCMAPIKAERPGIVKKVRAQIAASAGHESYFWTEYLRLISEE